MGIVIGLDVDTAAISVAREVSQRVIPRITWCAADALELPLSDESFDVVFCQQGMQFVSDAAAALSEMRRVLAPDGRLAVSVWRGVRDGACSAALAAALERHIGPDAVEDMRLPCAFGDVEGLRSLTTRAGLKDIRTGIVVENARADSAEELLEQAVLMSSLATSLSRLDSGVRARLIAELDEALLPCVQDGRLAVPIEATVALARR
jgi:SAM-dependent methyltransferase